MVFAPRPLPVTGEVTPREEVALRMNPQDARSGYWFAASRLAVGLSVSFLLGACGDDGGTGPDLPELRDLDLSGQVFTVDGGAPDPVVVTVSSLAGKRSVVVARDGRFRLETKVAGDTVDFIVSGIASDSRYHPALIRTASRTLSDLRVVLVPRVWTIDRGTYAGQKVEISVDDAFRPPCENRDDTNCDGFYPRVWTTGLKLWGRSSLPIPVSFDRERSTSPITAADSAAYWEIVDRMNKDFGTVLFVPAVYEDLEKVDDGRVLGGITVRVDETLSGFGAWTNWWWAGTGEMWTGVIRLRRPEFIANLSLMTHELLHTQGFKHSCSWHTVMGGYGCSSHPGLSPHDVAYAHLALAVNERQRATGAPHGLIAALQGERVITRGLQPFRVLDPERLIELRMDGVGDLLLP